MASRPEPAAASIEWQTIQKMRIRILPYILLLYIVSFLDRINISFAALTMNQELGITSQQFGFLVGIFFVGYSIFEIPSNVILHKVGARIWIARILIVWGTVAALTGFVRTVHELYVVRFLLGLAEAGYTPGILLYLTYWFRRRDQAQAIALFMIAQPISSVLGAPLSGLLLDHVHWFGMGSWRWLLILEGLPAVIFGVLTYFLLPNRPAEARFLTESEKNWITMQLKHEEDEKRETHQISAAGALIHGRVWHLACANLCTGMAAYPIIFWMPQIVKELFGRYSSTIVGFLVVIPNILAVLLMIAVSRSSDRKLERRWHTAIPALVAGTACLVFGATHSIFLSVVLLFLAGACMYGYLGPFWALPSEFLEGASAASGIALVTAFGSLSGFVGPYAVGLILQKTGSVSAALGFAGIVYFLFATLVLLLPRVSRDLAEEFPRPSFRES